MQMSLTIVVLFEAEVLMRFQDIFYQDSVLLKFWLVLLEFNFLTTRSISCTDTSIKANFYALYGQINRTQSQQISREDSVKQSNPFKDLFKIERTTQAIKSNTSLSR